MTRNRVPGPALLLTSIRPSCASTIFRTIARPEARALRLGREERIEDPVGQLRRHARAVVGDVDDDGRRRRLDAGERRVRLDRARSTAVIVMRPLPSSASNALVSRLVNTWQS